MASMTYSSTNPSFDAQRQRLRDIYGIVFPDDLFHFWQFANEISPDNPYELPINIQLVGAFEFLGGLIDETNPPALDPPVPLRMHWRFYKDPPEFFTVLCGQVDGLHFGYYYDDINTLPGCVAGYFHHDTYTLFEAGATIFDAVKKEAETYLNSLNEWIEEGRYDTEDCAEELADFQEFLAQLQSYCDRHTISALAGREKTAATWDDMGIIVPPETYRPLTQQTKADKLVEAQTALNEGFPGTALKFAKDLWSLHDPAWEPEAIALMQAAYTALDRTLLRDILQEHLESREPDLASLDLLFLARALEPS
jgi:hypothetical protein